MKKKIIVAPLNWGLGHASRCIPIIQLLIKNNFTPIIASDGNALAFLKKEFSELEFVNLPSYNIKYGKNLKLSLLLQLPKIWFAVRKEQKIIKNYIASNKDVVGIISDNRFGIRSNKAPSVYLTHQINVLSGITTFFTSYFHQKIIEKFDECWIPDNKKSQFSGKLSSGIKDSKYKYIGVLSRFKKENLKESIDVLIILSGPEPNRTLLEEKLKKEFLNSSKKIVLIQGKVENLQRKFSENNIIIYNFLLAKDLQSIINKSKVVICRSGYSSIMDLSVIGKKAFFIPTKNQSEQEYLANYLSEKKIAPFCEEGDFKEGKLQEIGNYTGLKTFEAKLNPKLISLFERKRKL